MGEKLVVGKVGDNVSLLEVLREASFDQTSGPPFH